MKKKLLSMILIGILAIPLSLTPVVEKVLDVNDVVQAAATEVPGDAIELGKSKGNTVAGFDYLGGQMYGGDPSILVDGDTVYLYVGHDVSTGSGGYSMPDWHVYSTKDMNNWVAERGPGDDGSVMSASTTHIPWATGNEAWAGQVMKHYDSEMGKNYYYFYHCSGNPKKIGVGVADTPTGWSNLEAKLEYCTAKGITFANTTAGTNRRDSLMFVDIGQPLVNNGITWPFHANHDDIDPTAWVEKDKNGVERRYLGWGNTWLFICELNDDMISIKDKDGNGLITMKTTRSLLTRDGSLSINHSSNKSSITQLIDRDYTYPSNVTYTDYTGNSYTIPQGSSYPDGDIICSKFYTTNKFNTSLTTPYRDDARTIKGIENEGRDLEGMLTYNEDKTQLNGLFSWRWNDLYQTYDPEYHFLTEGPYLYRRQDENGNYFGKYYSFFAVDWREQIGYATSDDLNEANWEYQDVIMPFTTNADTNHPAVFNFKGRTYFVYHNGSMPFGLGYRRTVCVEEIIFDEDGLIEGIQETATGITGTISWIGDSSGNIITHQNFVNPRSGPYPYVGTNAKSVDMVRTEDEGDSRWEIIPGRADESNPNYVSIESWNRPGTYLTVSGTNIVLAHMATAANNLPSESDRTAIAKSLTFKTLTGLSGVAGSVTLESVSSPGMYLTSQDNDLILTDGSDAAACSFTITNRGALDTISLKKEKTTYLRNETFDVNDLAVTAIRHGGEKEKISNKDCIIDVSEVKTDSAGTKYMYVTYREDNFQRTEAIEITVITPTIAISQSALTLKSGESRKLEATTVPQNAAVVWSSSNPAIADVDQNGNITAKAVGNATISAKANDLTVTCAVTVVTNTINVDSGAVTVVTNTINVDSVAVSPRSPKLKPGATQRFNATVLPANATNRAVVWRLTGNKSKSTTIAADGTLKIAANETATKLTITSTSVQDGMKFANTTVTITYPRTAAPNKKAVPGNQTVKKGAKITLRAPKNTVIYFTTNGKKPTTKSSHVKANMSRKITISKRTTLKAFAIRKGATASNIITRKYKVRATTK